MRVFVVAAFSLALFVCQTAVAGEFPLSTKGYQATITKITGQNTDHAIALGQVMRPNAEEYCNRDPGGITKQYGGQLTIAQCIEGILTYEKDKKVSATADCPRKKVTAEWGGSYVIVSKVFDGSCWKYILEG